MDVRDGTTGLKPENVSLLFFERRDLEVSIHSLRIDEAGNVLDAPPSPRGKLYPEGKGADCRRWLLQQQRLCAN